MLNPRFATLIMVCLCAAFVAIYVAAIRPWHMRWGATESELTMSLPGDKFVPPTAVVSTRALTIRATPKEIWPWLVQLGQGRGGYYSYDWLENLFAADMHNADTIVPTLQHIDVGDHISLQGNGPYMTVAYVDPEHALVMEGGWGWYLEPVDAESTRLIVRYASFEVNNWTSALFYYPIFEPAHCVMELGMMLGIAGRAEKRQNEIVDTFSVRSSTLAQER